MSDTYTPAGSTSPGKGGPGEIKYLSIARVNDAQQLLALPSATTKKAYADEVRIANLNNLNLQLIMFLVRK